MICLEYFSKKSCGAKHFLLISESGSVYAFGSNKYYRWRFAQIGKPNKNSSYLYSLIFLPILKVNYMSLTTTEQCHLSEQNKIFVWENTTYESFVEPKEVNFD